MTIYRKEVYVVDGYTFNNIVTAKAYEKVRDQLKLNFDYQVSGRDNKLIITDEQNNVEFEVSEIYGQSLVLSHRKVDTNPIITTSRIIDYHKKGFDFVYDDGVKYLYLESDLENLENDLTRFAGEVKYF